MPNLRVGDITYYITKVITWADAMPCNATWVGVIKSGRYNLDLYAHPEGYFIMKGI